jgi:hypothetical protein
MWTLFEPVHAVTYFAPEARSAFEEAGLRGFWRGYFAGRAAPLAPVNAAVVGSPPRAGTFTPPWKSPLTRPQPVPGPASARPPRPAWPRP